MHTAIFIRGTDFIVILFIQVEYLGLSQSGSKSHT